MFLYCLRPQYTQNAFVADRFFQFYVLKKSFKYSWLPITQTLANSNQPLDFRHTFTAILPSVTRTLDNSNLPLTRSSFCFPSDHFYIILPSITRTVFWTLKSREKTVYWRRNIEFWISHWCVVRPYSLLVEADVVCRKSNLLLKTVKCMLY